MQRWNQVRAARLAEYSTYIPCERGETALYRDLLDQGLTVIIEEEDQFVLGAPKEETSASDLIKTQDAEYKEALAADEVKDKAGKRGIASVDDTASEPTASKQSKSCTYPTPSDDDYIGKARKRVSEFLICNGLDGLKAILGVTDASIDDKINPRTLASLVSYEIFPATTAFDDMTTEERNLAHPHKLRLKYDHVMKPA